MLAVNSGGPLESVVEGETGFLRPPEPTAWAECLARLLRDAGLRGRLGQAGRARARERFSLEAGEKGHGAAALRRPSGRSWTVPCAG